MLVKMLIRLSGDDVDVDDVVVGVVDQSSVSNNDSFWNSTMISEDDVIVTPVKMRKLSSFGTSSSSNRVTLIRQQRTYFKKPSLSH